MPKKQNKPGSNKPENSRGNAGHHRWQIFLPPINETFTVTGKYEECDFESYKKWYFKRKGQAALNRRKEEVNTFVKIGLENIKVGDILLEALWLEWDCPIEILIFEVLKEKRDLAYAAGKELIPSQEDREKIAENLKKYQHDALFSTSVFVENIEKKYQVVIKAINSVMKETLTKLIIYNGFCSFLRNTPGNSMLKLNLVAEVLTFVNKGKALDEQVSENKVINSLKKLVEKGYLKEEEVVQVHTKKTKRGVFYLEQNPTTHVSLNNVSFFSRYDKDKNEIVYESTSSVKATLGHILE